MPAAQKMPFYECQHIRPSGSKCAAIAIRGHRFCYFHLQLRRSQSSVTPAEAAANGATAAVPAAATIAMPMLEDRTAVQLVLTEVLRALTVNQIDTKRASLLLYGLQIASANCNRLDEIGNLSFRPPPGSHPRGRRSWPPRRIRLRNHA